MAVEVICMDEGSLSERCFLSRSYLQGAYAIIYLGFIFEA